MKEFDIYTIGKKMPYAEPAEGFFESITTDTLTKIAQRKKRGTIMRRAVIMTLSAAASISLFLIASTTINNQSQNKIDLLDDNLSAYLQSISDEELDLLIDNMEPESAFYSNI